MDELKFVLKCFVFASVLVALSQYRMEGGETIEARVHSYLVSSTVSKFVNESARGGVKAIRKISAEVSEYFGREKVKLKRRPIHSAVQSKNAQIDSEEDIDLD